MTILTRFVLSCVKCVKKKKKNATVCPTDSQHFAICVTLLFVSRYFSQEQLASSLVLQLIIGGYL